jgi:hypothetical protein
MAVIIEEEEKKPINWTAVITIAVIVIVLFAGSYYVFFQKPELIEIVAPRELQTISAISLVEFDPATVVNSPTFKLLRQYGTPVTPPPAGRDNPFEPF